MPPRTIKAGSVSIKIYRSSAVANGKKYQQFRVVYYDSVGRRVRESKPTEQAALERAEQLALNLSQQKIGGDLTAEQVASFRRASEILAPTHKPVELACAEYAEAHAILGGLPLVEAAKDFAARRGVNLPQKMTADVLTELLRANQADGLTRLSGKERMLRKFTDAFPGPITTIQAADVHRWIAGLKHYLTKEPVSRRTQKNYRLYIASLFTFAKNAGYLNRSINYLDGVGFTTAPHGKASPYSPEELAKVLRCAERHKSADMRRMIPYLAVRAFAGVRFYECHRVKLADLHLAERLIVLDAGITKTGKSRAIPMQDNLAAWLTAWAGKPGPLCAGDDRATDNRMAALFRDAGVTTQHNGLRDSFVSYRLAILGDVGKVSQESGHSPSELEQSYRAVRLPDGRLITKALAEKYFAICPQVVRKRKTA